MDKNFYASRTGELLDSKEVKSRDTFDPWMPTFDPWMPFMWPKDFSRALIKWQR